MLMVLTCFVDMQTSKELIHMDINKMMITAIFTNTRSWKMSIRITEFMIQGTVKPFRVLLTLKLPGPYVGMSGSLTVTVA